jgi:hypothetical protein
VRHALTLLVPPPPPPSYHESSSATVHSRLLFTCCNPRLQIPFFLSDETTLSSEYTECQAFYPVVKIGSSHPLSHKRVLHPHFGSMGGDTLAFRGGGGGQGVRNTLLWVRGWGDPIPTMGQTVWYSKYTNYNPSTARQLSDQNSCSSRLVYQCSISCFLPRQLFV